MVECLYFLPVTCQDSITIFSCDNYSSIFAVKGLHYFCCSGLLLWQALAFIKRYYEELFFVCIDFMWL